MRINRDAARVLRTAPGFRRSVFNKISRHPVIFSAGQTFHGLPEIATMQSSAAFAGRTDQSHREPRLECKSNQGGFAVPRHAFNSHMRRIDQWVRFKVVKRARRTPGPCAKRTPVVGLAGLASVNQPDNTPCHARTVVGLNACWID